MSFKARLLFALLAVGMGAAVLSRGSSLPVLTTPSTSVGFVSAPGLPLLRHGQFSPLVGPRWNGVHCRDLSSRPVRRALCLAAVAARDGGDVNAARDKVAKAKARLVKAECELDAAQEADSVDVQRIAKAELGVAKAELGVAKAELGVAKAELGVANAEWKAAPESEKAVFLANIAKAEVSVAKAEVGVAKAELQAAPESEKAVFLASFETARMAYEKALNPTTASQLQGLQGADLVVDLVRKALKGACNMGDECLCASPEGCSIERNYSLDNNVIVSKMLRNSAGPLFLDRQDQIDTLKELLTTRLKNPNWTSDKGYNPLFVVSNAQGHGKSLFLAKSGEILTGPGGVLAGAAVLPFSYNSGMTSPVKGVSMETAVMLRAIYGGLMSSMRVEGCGNGVMWTNFLSAFNKRKRFVTEELESLTLSDWLEAARELMGRSRTASKSSQLLLLADEVVKVDNEEGGGAGNKQNTDKIYSLLGEALETSRFNHVLISSLSPNYAYQKMTRSQRKVITEGLVMTLISTSKRGVAKQLLDVVLSKAQLTDKNMTSDKKRVFQIAQSLSGGHPRSLESIIITLSDNKSTLSDNKSLSLWDQKNWRTVFKKILEDLSASDIAPFRMPSNTLLEEIATRRPVPSMRSHNVWADEEPAMTVSAGVEHGYLHIVPGHDTQAGEIIVDLLPSQMSQAVVRAPRAHYSQADWGKTWNTTSNATRPTALQYLCLLLHDFLSLSKGKFNFTASDGAELCAAWSVIRSIQEGEPSTVLGPRAAKDLRTTDVVLESHQIRTPRSLDCATTSKKSSQEETLERKKFAARVQELRAQGADHWTVLLPPLEWPDVDLYVVAPRRRGAESGNCSAHQSHLVGISVKSNPGNCSKQLEKLKTGAQKAKDISGSEGVQSDSFVGWLGYDIGTFHDWDPIFDLIVTPSKVRDLVPRSVMSLCLLTTELAGGAGPESSDSNADDLSN